MNENNVIITPDLSPYVSWSSKNGSPIERFIWCKKCYEEIEELFGNDIDTDRILNKYFVEIGLTEENTLVVWCVLHQEKVKEFTLLPTLLEYEEWEVNTDVSS